MASKRGTLSRKKITPELVEALTKAAVVMNRKRLDVLTAETLLLTFATTQNTGAYKLLRYFYRQQGFDWSMFVNDVDRAVDDRKPARDQQFDFVTDNNKRMSLGHEMLVLLDEGLTIAKGQSSPQCSSAHVLVVMANIQIGTHWLLNRRGITQRAVFNEITGYVDNRAVAEAKTVQVTSIYHRSKLEQKLVNLLSMKRERNVILVGQNGVGRRSLVVGVGELIVQKKGPFGIGSVVEISEEKLLDDPYSAVVAGVKKARGGILFVPDIARFFGGIRADFGEKAGNELQKAFLSNDVVVIGTATEEAFGKKLKSARVIAEHGQQLRVPPAQVDETVEMLRALKGRFEVDYELKIEDKSLAETARLAGRYYTAKPLPGAAVDLLHRACAMVKTSRRTASQLSIKNDKQLDPDDVMITASLLTGIPVNSMGADERNRYINMVGHLQKRIIGQEAAVMALSRAVKMARVGLKDPKRPIGSFLFLGPTGVGKSELAKALAEFLFATERALITLDMSEYMDASSVNRLIGSPPGYVGHEAGGQLTDAIKSQPYSVVLFDEVEKANTKVFDTLLQVMDEGRLTSGQGETVSFSECVILMTSNIGGHHLADVRLSKSIEVQTGQGHDVNQPAYNKQNIRAMLDAGFSEDELFSLFAANPLFSIEDDEAGEALDKAGVITQLIAQAQGKSQFDLLLELAESYNAGKFKEHQPYFNWGVACRRAEGELKSHFRPEFLNRLDDIIYFHPLTDTHLRKILNLLLKKEETLLRNQGLELEITERAKTWLLKQNEHPEWGARPLRRLIQRHIRERLAEYMLANTPPSGTIMKVQERSGGLKIGQAKKKAG